MEIRCYSSSMDPSLKLSERGKLLVHRFMATRSFWIVFDNPSATGKLQNELDEFGEPRRLILLRYNYPLLLKELRKRQYRGFISVEDFDNNRPPEQRVDEAISDLHKIDPSRVSA